MIRNNKLNFLTAIALIMTIAIGFSSCKKKEKEFTVTFETGAGGSLVDQQVVKQGGKVVKPADPTRDGYVFDKWYKEAAHTTEWNFASDEVRGNTTLYAKWTAPDAPKSVSVGLQSGALTAGTINSATFAVTTVNIANDVTGSVTWTDEDGTPTTAYPLTRSITAVSSNSATVTIGTQLGARPTPAGEYYFTVTIDGATSEVVTVTVDPADDTPTTKAVSIGAQTGVLVAGAAGSATFTVTTTLIDNGQAGTVNFSDATGSFITFLTGLSASVTNVLDNSATITITASGSQTAATRYFFVVIDGVKSDAVEFTVLPAGYPLPADFIGTWKDGARSIIFTADSFIYNSGGEDSWTVNNSVFIPVENADAATKAEFPSGYFLIEGILTAATGWAAVHIDEEFGNGDFFLNAAKNKIFYYGGVFEKQP